MKAFFEAQFSMCNGAADVLEVYNTTMFALNNAYQTAVKGAVKVKTSDKAELAARKDAKAVSLAIEHADVEAANERHREAQKTKRESVNTIAAKKAAGESAKAEKPKAAPKAKAETKKADKPAAAPKAAPAVPTLANGKPDYLSIPYEPGKSVTLKYKYHGRAESERVTSASFNGNDMAGQVYLLKDKDGNYSPLYEMVNPDLMSQLGLKVTDYATIKDGAKSWVVSGNTKPIRLFLKKQLGVSFCGRLQTIGEGWVFPKSKYATEADVKKALCL